MKMRFLSIPLFWSVLLVSCADVSHEHNFAEFIEANYKFRTSGESEAVFDAVQDWALQNGFQKQEGSEDPTTFEAILDPLEPRFHAKLFLYREGHGSNSLQVEMKTDRWGNRQDHRRQKRVTDSLRADFEKRFPGNFRVDVVMEERDGVEVRTNKHVPLDDSFPGIK